MKLKCRLQKLQEFKSAIEYYGVHGIWSSKTRTTNANILGRKCRWNLSIKFWYEGGKWRLWNIETIDEEYWRWKIDGRSCGQHNIDLWSTND